MPYPSKTDRETILAAAVEQAARDGLDQLSLRSLASSLGLAPNALYRYFAGKAHLESAISAEAANRLHAGLAAACGKRGPEQALLHMARAYLHFAQANRSLYVIFMACRSKSTGDDQAHQQLWDFVLAQVARLCGDTKAPEASVALWAFLHGFAVLDAAGAIDAARPATGFEFGLKAWIAAVKK
jgi:AcrR family transcriptional regulator